MLANVQHSIRSELFVIHMPKYNLGCEIAFLSFDWDAIIVKRAKGAIPTPRKQRQYIST